jgi:hypothetical protein
VGDIVFSQFHPVAWHLNAPTSSSRRGIRERGCASRYLCSCYERLEILRSVAYLTDSGTQYEPQNLSTMCDIFYVHSDQPMARFVQPYLHCLDASSGCRSTLRYRPHSLVACCMSGRLPPTWQGRNTSPTHFPTPHPLTQFFI